MIEVGHDSLESLNLSMIGTVQYHISFTSRNETSLMDCGEKILPPLGWSI
jgi:hypothetical protein